MLGGIYRYLESLFAHAGEVFLLLLRGVAAAPSVVPGRGRLLIQMNRVGTESVPLVLMIGLFVGMVTALETGIILKESLGLEAMVGPIVAVGLVREMGPVITAFIITGRVGSSIAAELGTMAVSEEIDALRSMGISPVRFLFVPRLFALLVMQPVLTAFSVAIGIWGGALVISHYLGFPAQLYYERAFEALDMDAIVDGFSKTFVFAALIATISTHMGMATRHGAQGVGRAVTRAVVASLTMVLIANYLMTRVMA
jgi:phospholipid/cholesterol/gamma-HCH transport system permease protein